MPCGGKTTILKLFLVRYPGQVFQLRKRASTGGYDETSLLGYKDETIIFVNNLRTKVSKNGKVVLPDALVELLSRLTDGVPIPFVWGSETYSPCVVAKLFVATTMELPDVPDLRRRFEQIVVGDGSNTEEFKVIQRITRRCASSDKWVRMAPDLKPAADFMIFERPEAEEPEVAHTEDDLDELLEGCPLRPTPAAMWNITLEPSGQCSEEWRSFVERIEMWVGFSVFLAVQMRSLATDDALNSWSTMEWVKAIASKKPEVEDSIQNDEDLQHLASCVEQIFEDPGSNERPQAADEPEAKRRRGSLAAICM